MTSRRLFFASVAVLGSACIACFFAGSLEWGDRGHMIGIDSAEASEQAHFAIELYAIGALNVVAAIGFLLRHWGWGLWLALGTQVAVFVWALIEGVAMNPDDEPGWFFFSALPLLTLILVFALRKRDTKLSGPGFAGQPANVDLQVQVVDRRSREKPA